jgi:hypothetical protein
MQIAISYKGCSRRAPTSLHDGDTGLSARNFQAASAMSHAAPLLMK